MPRDPVRNGFDVTATTINQSSILSILHGRASLRPNDIAFTFTDYEKDPAGVPEDLTWSELSHRTMALASQLSVCAAPGDRAVILAPQSLQYILAFLGAMQAGLIAVPLPLPNRGSSHERVGAVLADTSPAVVLTTSAATDDVRAYVAEARLDTAPTVIEVDALNLDSGGAESNLLVADTPHIAYLQYSSGSTRTPTGVTVSHRNLQVNFDQLMRCLFADSGITVPPTATMVSWLPFYHDMGLVLGVCAPILGGFRGQLSSPVAFLERPARWMRALAENPAAFSAAPNFAFDLAVRSTTDGDLAGLDLGGILGIISGAERVEQATLRRFADRFAHFNFRDAMLRPSYGLAEATVFVTSGTWCESTPPARFDINALSAGRVQRSTGGSGTALVRYRLPHSPLLRIVDSDFHRECPPDVVGEIWVRGDNVADGYWGASPKQQRCFNATLRDPTPGTPADSWLRTGDLGFISQGELFIVGRIKDVLIIRGRNHYPEDIEATVQRITRGRVAAVSVPMGGTEELVTVIELKQPTGSAPEEMTRFAEIKSDVTSAISTAHGLNLRDMVLVPAGSIPTTTSGKIRRSACVEHYRQSQFTRLDSE